MVTPVMFLCDRNTVRSPMAAALLGPHASSAGLAPDDTVDPFACAVMAEAGRDITGHTPTQIHPDAIAPGTLVIALSPACFAAARDWRRTVPFELDYWDLPAIPAPDGHRDAILDGYRTLRRALETHIANRFGPAMD